jgi:ArsR family transcriptional regulator, arsenate/arsenite/antimonite-responsive transcriptional repressor
MEKHIILLMYPDPEIVFQMLADTTRLRIVALLQGHGELCVCELTQSLSLSQPKISRHLGQLRESDLVEARRAGRWMYYRIRDDLPGWIRAVLQATFEEMEALSPYKEDAQSLEQMLNRPDASCCA